MAEPIIQTSSLAGVLQITRPTFPDDRGFFRESFRKTELEQALNTSFDIKQMNHSRSSKSTLRGIHSAPWNKLIYVTRGTVQSVIVDLREDSPTFGKYESFIIGEENKASIFVPAYTGNSYLVLSEDADYTYLTDQEWEPGKEIGVAWNDPDIAVKWEIADGLLLSEKDKQNQPFKEVFPR
ncbi:MAG: dTDP-4-dehydrorhamnose 3,5-epimerase [Patescibacteria group bacterium]